MLTKKQKEFCVFATSGDNPSAAYQKAFGTAKGKANTVSASRLLKRADIKAEIERLNSETRKLSERAHEIAAGKLADGSIADKAERMEILTQIMRGQIPLKKPMVCDGVIEEIDVVPDWMDRKNAIAELNKMTGDYSPIKTDITSDGKAINTPAAVISFDGKTIELLQ